MHSHYVIIEIFWAAGYYVSENHLKAFMRKTKLQLKVRKIILLYYRQVNIKS